MIELFPFSDCPSEKKEIDIVCHFVATSQNTFFVNIAAKWLETPLSGNLKFSIYTDRSVPSLYEKKRKRVLLWNLYVLMKNV